ncbi:hypothetical protein [Nocardia sp. 348MFTsu5.1]|uniref:hypothetical protein n=1 Tax=Nocardia sp. 348MFTsu5.1 TaxID=1172185 RepID=UPI00036E84CF|nr:hypothetical protein [Nocardia sp. 348MFTsu5.1]
MTMAAALTVGICVLLIVVALLRLSRPPSDATPTFWAYTQVCLLMGAGKLARTPHFTDDLINPVISRATGLSNAMTLVGMTLAACAAVPAVALMWAVTGHEVRYRPWLYAQIAIVAVMTVTYISSPIDDIPSSYITADIPFTPMVYAYWLVFLGAIGIAGALNAVLAVRAYRVVRRGPFALTLLGWACTAALVCIYTVNKIVDLALTDVNVEAGWYSAHVRSVSLAIALLIVLTASATVLIYPVVRLPHRWGRFQVLRRSAGAWSEARTQFPAFVLPGSSDVPTNQWQCWTAAKDPVSAYNLQVEIADAANAAASQERSDRIIS